MRLEQNTCDRVTREFSQWILKIGEGKLDDSEGEALIEITFNLTIQRDTHPIEDIVYTTYPEL
jgi:hypothetical protein